MYRLILSLLLIASVASAQVDATFRAYRSVNATDSTLLTGKPAGTFYYNTQSNKWRAKDAVGWFDLRSSGGGSAHVIENAGTPLTARANLNFSNGLTASDNTPDTDIKLGGAITGVTTLTSNAANRWVFDGTWTTTASNDYHMNFGGSFTTQNVASERIFAYQFTPTLTSAASASQLAAAVYIAPTFASGGTAFAGLTSLWVGGRSVFSQQGYSASTSNTATVAIYGAGAGTGVGLITYNSSFQERLRVSDNGSVTSTAAISNGFNIAHTWTGNGPDHSVITGSGTQTGRATSSDAFYWLRLTNTMTTGATNQTPILFNSTTVFTASHTGAAFKGFQITPSFAGAQLASAGFEVWRHDSGYVRWASVLSPAQITSNQNDYNPTGWTTGGAPYGASIMRASTDASRNVTSITGGVDGRLAFIANVGSQNLVLTDDDGSSGTAANRFALAANITLAPDQFTFGFYDATASRWRWLPLGGGTTETASNGLTKTVNDIALGGVLTGNTAVNGAGTYSLTLGSGGSTLTTFVVNTNSNIVLSAGANAELNGTTATGISSATANAYVDGQTDVSLTAITGAASISAATSITMDSGAGNFSIQGNALLVTSAGSNLIQSTTAATNTVTNVLSVLSASSGTPANGIGTGIQFITHTDVALNTIGAGIESISTDVTSSSEDFDLVFKTMSAGATAAERLRIRADGQAQFTKDVAVTNSANGIILKDTQGTPHYWRVTISTVGVLTTTDLGTSLP